MTDDYYVHVLEPALSWGVGALVDKAGVTALSARKLMIRPSRFRSNPTASPCKRSWGATLRNSTLNLAMVGGQLGVRIPRLTILVIVSYSFCGVPDQLTLARPKESMILATGESSSNGSAAALRLSL